MSDSQHRIWQYMAYWSLKLRNIVIVINCKLWDISIQRFFNSHRNINVLCNCGCSMLCQKAVLYKMSAVIANKDLTPCCSTEVVLWLLSKNTCLTLFPTNSKVTSLPQLHPETLPNCYKNSLVSLCTQWLKKKSRCSFQKTYFIFNLPPVHSSTTRGFRSMRWREVREGVDEGERGVGERWVRDESTALHYKISWWSLTVA